MAYDEYALQDTIQATASVIAVAGIGLLFLTVTAAALRRRHPRSKLVIVADRLVPNRVYRSAIAAVSLIAGLVSLLGGRPAAADESIREWLSTPTTNALPAPAPTSASVSSVDPPTPEPSPATTATTGTAASGTVPPGTWVRTTVPTSHPITPAPTRARTPPPTGPSTSSATRPVPTTAARRSTVPPAPPRLEPETPPAPAPPPTTAATSTPDRAHYTVRLGDCLWDIAAAHLPTGAANADIDRAWRAIYAANADAIGGDPGLIHPGLTLTLPAFP